MYSFQSVSPDADADSGCEHSLSFSCLRFPDLNIIHIANPGFDYANPFGGYTVTITVDDGEFTGEATLTVTVDNTVNEAPDLAVNKANISESGAVNSVVYTVSELMLCHSSTASYTVRIQIKILTTLLVTTSPFFLNFVSSMA